MKVRRWFAALLRTWRGRFIAAFLLVQVIAPLHYYVARRDHHDERFAWRMFSPTRLMVCSDPEDVEKQPWERRPPRFTVAGERVVLGRQFHEAWVDLTKRGRYGVIERIGETLCAVNPGEQVRLSMACVYLDGTRDDTADDLDLCAHPEL
jgi:hypothetical protein